MLQRLALSALLFQATYMPTVLGHGNIIVPEPTGDADHEYYFGDPAGTIDLPEIIGTQSYSDYSTMADYVAGWMTDNSFDNLKQFIDTYGSNISECGWTEKDGVAQPVPSDGYAQHDTLGNSHPGPCEIWCDDTRVYESGNCLDEFSGESPAMIPIDVSTCEASAEFVFYWMALHSQPWQIYINCVALDGTASSSSTAASSTTSSTAGEASAGEDAAAAATSTPSTTTEAPAATTAAPETEAPTATTAAATTTEAPTTETTEAPATETEAPATTTAAPVATTSAPSSAKCSTRRN